MKAFLSSALLAAASFRGAAAAAAADPSSATDELPSAAVASSSSVGDFTDAFACTADLSTGSVTDESGCATATDANGAACLWCDASAILGQGVCVTADAKSAAGQFWDALCAGGDNGAASSVGDEDGSEAGFSPDSPNEAPGDDVLFAELPTDEAAVGAAAGDFADAFACTADPSTGSVTDEPGCATATDAAGAACLWCDASAILGQGVCVSADAKSAAGQFWDALCAGHASGDEDVSASAPAAASSSVRGASSAADEAPGEVAVGDFLDALQCTVNLSTGDIADETGCAAATDAAGAACLWCDASAIVGRGLCLCADAKAMAGQFWDQFCASDGSGNPPAPATTTPPPTPLPTPKPTEAAPAPVPAPDDGPDDSVPDALKCSIDASSNLIADESTCVAKVDPTSSSGEKCVWCSLPLLGGNCMTNDDKSAVSFLCSSGEGGERRGGKNLRGDWKALDPSCLGDDGLSGGTKEGCGARVDANGEKCVWCDAGDDVFGVCATPSQREYIGGYLDCADDVASEDPVVVAVE